MVGVATKIDAPIKLVFKAKGKTGSILGLGDIVVPGILIGFMLRFDHYMYYKQKIYQVKHVPKDIASSDSSRHDASTEAMTIPRKVPYIDVTDHWGDYLWTRRWGRLLRTTKDARTTAAENPYASCPAFPKPYFIASLAGYALGMAATVAVVMLTGHGQPALLYLVPAVSVVPVLTALARGQFKELLEYTEDGSLDTETVVVPVEGDEKGGGLEVREKHQVEEDKQADKKAGVEMVGRVGGKSHNSGNGIVDANNGKRADSVEGSPRLLDSGGRKPRARKRVPRLRDGGFEVFRLSITAPGDPVRLASIE